MMTGKQKDNSWASYYKDSRWQKMRLEVMERDEWTCRGCEKKDGITLNVHHGYYITGKKPWEYDPDDLLTLCESCHKKMHELQTELTRCIFLTGLCCEGHPLTLLKELLGFVHGYAGPSFHKGNEYESGYAKSKIEINENMARQICKANEVAERKEI